jgi:hypothetical protein
LSDEDDNAAGPGLFDNSRSSREQRVRDFLAASGLTFNDILKPIRDNPLWDSEVVTEAHRELVIDLKASGCSDEGVARFFRITPQKCRRLFEWELDNGRQMRTAQVVRSLNVNAIHLGDTSAQIGYLKNQPQEEWGTKHSQKNVDTVETTPDDVERLSQNEAFIAGITAGLAIDAKYHKPAARREMAAAAKPAPGRKAITTSKPVTKARGD